MSVLDKLKKFVFKKELGITYDIDPTQDDAKARGGTFLELKIISTDFTREKDISQIPLERSKVFNDNTRLKPIKGKMRVLVTNNIDFLVSVNAFNSLFRSEVETKLNTFEKIHREGLMCDITTMTREYKNMQLVSYSVVEDPQNAGKYLLVDMFFEEMMLFELVTKQDSKRLSLTDDNGAGLKNNAGILG